MKKPKELKIDLPLENTSWHNQNYKPPSSPLNQIRPPLFDVKILETFKEELEESEDRNDSIVALTDRLVISHTEDLEKDELERFKGNSLLSVSYKPSQQSPLPTGGDELGGSFVSAFAHSLNSSFNLPFVTSPTKDRDSFLFPTVARNPNKALVTIDAKSSLILVANEVTCNLFGYQKCDLVGLKIQHLFTQPYQSRQRALVEENIDSTGETVLISGKVVSYLHCRLYTCTCKKTQWNTTCTCIVKLAIVDTRNKGTLWSHCNMPLQYMYMYEHVYNQDSCIGSQLSRTDRFDCTIKLLIVQIVLKVRENNLQLYMYMYLNV